jgi:hypothetical protein
MSEEKLRVSPPRKRGRIAQQVQRPNASPQRGPRDASVAGRPARGRQSPDRSPGQTFSLANDRQA